MQANITDLFGKISFPVDTSTGDHRPDATPAGVQWTHERS